MTEDCNCGISANSECSFFAIDEITITESVMRNCTVEQYVSLISELNHIKHEKQCNILFSLSDMDGMPIKLVLTNHRRVCGKTVTKNLLVTWNNFSVREGRHEDTISRKVMYGEGNIFTAEYKDFGDFCTAFDEFCCDITDMEEEELNEERSNWAIVIIDIKDSPTYRELNDGC